MAPNGPPQFGAAARGGRLHSRETCAPSTSAIADRLARRGAGPGPDLVRPSAAHNAGRGTPADSLGSGCHQEEAGREEKSPPVRVLQVAGRAIRRAAVCESASLEHPDAGDAGQRRGLRWLPRDRSRSPGGVADRDGLPPRRAAGEGAAASVGSAGAADAHPQGMDADAPAAGRAARRRDLAGPPHPDGVSPGAGHGAQQGGHDVVRELEPDDGHDPHGDGPRGYADARSPALLPPGPARRSGQAGAVAPSAGVDDDQPRDLGRPAARRAVGLAAAGPAGLAALGGPVDLHRRRRAVVRAVQGELPGPLSAGRADRPDGRPERGRPEAAVAIVSAAHDAVPAAGR